MKIAVIGPTYPYRGGIAHYTTLLVAALRLRHAVRLYSFRRMYPRILFPGQSDRDPSTQAIRIEDTRYAVDSLKPWTWWQVGGEIAAWHPDVAVIAWWIPFWGIAFGEIAKRVHSASPVLFLCHNVVPHEQRVTDRLLTWHAWRHADGFLVHSIEDERRLRELLPEARVWMTPHPTYSVFGQPIDRVEARRQVGAQSCVLLFFGLVRPYKGLADLIEALPAVVKEVDAHLIVAGEIWGDAGVYHRRVEELGLTGRVRFVNRYIPNEEVAAYFVAADLVVLPYRSASGSGVLQIAYGLGVPVVATAVGGLADAVRDGETGFLVPPGDPPALAEAICRYFKEERAQPFAQAIRAQRSRFDWSGIEHVIESAATELRR